jgi:hypothetical protein
MVTGDEELMITAKKPFFGLRDSFVESLSAASMSPKYACFAKRS